MVCSNHRAENLYLSVMHSSARYETRKNLGMLALHPANHYDVIIVARQMAFLVGAEANTQTRKFQPEEPFTPEDILEAAMHLVSYYRDHARELELDQRGEG